MSDEQSPADADAKPAKPKKAPGGGKAGILLTFINLGATGFLVFRSLTGAAHAPLAAGEAEHAAPAKPVKPVPGPIAAMDAFVVNLRDEGVSRYLKTSFELELDTPESLAELETAKRAVRDDLLRYLSNLTVNDTLGEEAKQKIQDGIVARLDRKLGPGHVKKLYFTDFVIQ